MMKTEHQDAKVADPTTLPEFLGLQERMPQLKELALKKPKEKEKADA